MKKRISAEVDKIINLSSDNEQCCKQFNNSSEFSVTGADDILKIFDYTYLIPNLFRKCYSYNTLPIPSICINNITNINTDKFLPFLLNENIIKSLLYFNFPVNIKYYKNINSYINNVVNYKKIISKNLKYSTYGSKTPVTTLYNYVYSTNSMLTNLLMFNTTMQKVSNLSQNQENTCSYNIPWDYTTGCYLTEKQYIVGQFNNNNIITQQTFDILNYIRYTFFNVFTNTNLNYNLILLVYVSNIYRILDYAQEVYVDILTMYNYVLNGTDYCLQSYMEVSNIPNLMKLYNNFYNNQIYSNNNALPKSSIVSLIPQQVTLETLINNFTTTFNSNPSNGIIFNVVKLNSNEGFIFTYNKKTSSIIIDNASYLNIDRSDYSYYYLNTDNLGSTQIYNYWGITGNIPTYTNSSGSLGTTIVGSTSYQYNSNFTSNFIFGTNGISGISGSYSWSIGSYLKITNSKSVTIDKYYENGGIYNVIYGFTGSITYTGITGITGSYYCAGAQVSFYNDILQTSLNSKVYLTFQTEGTGGTIINPNTPLGYGTALVYYPLVSEFYLYPPPSIT